MLALYAFLNASYGVFLKFMHLHCCMSSRYARCAMRGRETRDDGTELQDSDWWIDPEDGQTAWSTCLHWKCYQAGAN